MKWLGTDEELTEEEFESWQLEGQQVFCRHCGLTRGEAVPMEFIGKMPVPINVTDFDFDAYRCPMCDHHALLQVDGSGNLTCCPVCGAHLPAGTK